MDACIGTSNGVIKRKVAKTQRRGEKKRKEKRAARVDACIGTSNRVIKRKVAKTQSRGEKKRKDRLHVSMHA